MTVSDIERSTTREAPATVTRRPHAREAAPALAVALQGPRASRRRRNLTMSPTIAVSFAILLLFVLAGLLAPLLAPHDPLVPNLRARLRPPLFSPGGEATYPLGTDPLGRDVLSRLLFGARVSLSIGFAGMSIGLVIGTLTGLAAGFVRGRFDDLTMFLVDVFLALPFLVVALTTIAFLGNSLPVLIVLMGFSGWAAYTRLARAQALSAREQPYILAARALGATGSRLALRHILPNIMAPLIVLATFELTAVILLEASLSFLGLGLQPPTPSWGSMLGEGRSYLNTAWWVGIFPGVALIAVTTSVSLVGDWLRDRLDPTLRP